VLGSAPTLSPLGTLTYAAACTDRLRLGCAVFVTPLHGTPAARPPRASQACRRWRRPGAELILLNPLVDDKEQLERLAAEVVPALA